MAKYYYFVASLPALMFDQAPPFSMEDFLSGAERQLSLVDHALIKAVVQEEELPAHGVAGQWAHVRQQIKSTLASMRATRAGKDPAKYIRGDRPYDPIVTEAVQEAMKIEEPLAAERALDRRVWQILDNLQAGHAFDIGFLVVYALKLKMLERYKRIASDQGRQAFEAILKSERLAEVLATVGS